MKAADSSVLVAACLSWHESHEVARRAMSEHPEPVAHCALEAFSVLTRLPPSHRPPKALVVEFLTDALGGRLPLTLPPVRLAGLVSELVALDLDGGAVYDGLVGLTAAEHGAVLLSLDRRAAETYRRCRADYRLLV